MSIDNVILLKLILDGPMLCHLSESWFGFYVSLYNPSVFDLFSGKGGVAGKRGLNKAGTQLYSLCILICFYAKYTD